MKMIEVQCQECKHVQDELVQPPLAPFGEVQEFPEDAPFKCERCKKKGNPIRRPNGYGLDFRGSGFYVNDYSGKRG